MMVRNRILFSCVIAREEAKTDQTPWFYIMHHFVVQSNLSTMKITQILSLALLFQVTNAFVSPSTTTIAFSKAASVSLLKPSTGMNMLESALSIDMDTVTTVMSAAPSMMLSETEPWVQPLMNVLGPFFNIFSFAMVRKNLLLRY